MTRIDALTAMIRTQRMCIFLLLVANGLSGCLRRTDDSRPSNGIEPDPSGGSESPQEQTLAFRRSGSRLELLVTAPRLCCDFTPALTNLTVLLPQGDSSTGDDGERLVLAEGTRASLRLQRRLRHTTVTRPVQTAALPVDWPVLEVTLLLDASRHGNGTIELGDYKVYWYSPLRTLTLYLRGPSRVPSQSIVAPDCSDACPLAGFPDTIVISLTGSGRMAVSFLNDQWGLKDYWGVTTPRWMPGNLQMDCDPRFRGPALLITHAPSRAGSWQTGLRPRMRSTRLTAPYRTW